VALIVVGDVEARHHEADRDGVALHYVTAGHGPPLVLLHGFLGTWWAWRRVIPWLAQDYRVIAVDMRGYGDSDKPGRRSRLRLRQSQPRRGSASWLGELRARPVYTARCSPRGKPGTPARVLLCHPLSGQADATGRPLVFARTQAGVR
jgi:pimeloyl-ACP methyl ester carboxylesterase